jgi:peptide-methionine (S)-S-oxide reductase
MKALNDSNIFEDPIVTELMPLEVFYDAEDDHDSYYDLNREQPYCTYLIDPKIKKLTTYFKTILK